MLCLSFDSLGPFVIIFIELAEGKVSEGAPLLLKNLGSEMVQTKI
jgi:hypothetical protein